MNFSIGFSFSSNDSNIIFHKLYGYESESTYCYLGVDYLSTNMEETFIFNAETFLEESSSIVSMFTKFSEDSFNYSWYDEDPPALVYLNYVIMNYVLFKSNYTFTDSFNRVMTEMSECGSVLNRPITIPYSKSAIAYVYNTEEQKIELYLIESIKYNNVLSKALFIQLPSSITERTEVIVKENDCTTTYLSTLTSAKNLYQKIQESSCMFETFTNESTVTKLFNELVILEKMLNICEFYRTDVVNIVQYEIITTLIKNWRKSNSSVNSYSF